MSDNVALAGKTFATDQVSRGGATVDVEIVKLGFGDDGTYTGDVSRSVPLPVDAALRTDVIQNSGSQLTPKFTRAALTADGDIVAAVSGKKIRVLAMTVNTEVANDDLEVEDANGGTDLMNFLNIPLGMTVLPFNPTGWFETTAGNALYGNVTLAGATQINICVVYVEV